MKNDKQPKKLDETAITLIDSQSLDKPKSDTKFAHESAKFLMDIVNKNNWAKSLGGDKPHLVYEAWQTVGKYYGYTVKTHDAEYVEFGATNGFKAKADVINERTGVIVGGAEALCLNDEDNWKTEPHQNKWGKTIPGKPKFQLASMAQTRAGSKALRQILGFVVALAGYNPTPAEEMTGDENIVNATPLQNTQNTSPDNAKQTKEQKVSKDTTSGKCSICNASGKYHRPDCPNKE